MPDIQERKHNEIDPVDSTIHGGCGLPVLVGLLLVALSIFYRTQ